MGKATLQERKLKVICLTENLKITFSYARVAQTYATSTSIEQLSIWKYEHGNYSWRSEILHDFAGLKKVK